MEKKKFDLSSKIYSTNSIKRVEKKIKLLGVTNTYSAGNLLNIRLLTSIIMFFVLLYFLNLGYIVAPIVTFIYYVSFFPLLIGTKIKKREKRLEKDSLYFFEILALSLEAGRSIKTAIEVTTANVNSELSLEFEKLLKDMMFGKSLDEALDDLNSRIPSDAINNIILNIRQSNIFGNNILETVYSEVEYIREKRILDAKAQISKMPVKISVVSVIFFIPLLLLLLLGPIIIELLG